MFSSKTPYRYVSLWIQRMFSHLAEKRETLLPLLPEGLINTAKAMSPQPLLGLNDGSLKKQFKVFFGKTVL